MMRKHLTDEKSFHIYKKNTRKIVFETGARDGLYKMAVRKDQSKTVNVTRTEDNSDGIKRDQCLICAMYHRM